MRNERDVRVDYVCLLCFIAQVQELPAVFITFVAWCCIEVSSPSWLKYVVTYMIHLLKLISLG